MEQFGIDFSSAEEIILKNISIISVNEPFALPELKIEDGFIEERLN